MSINKKDLFKKEPILWFLLLVLGDGEDFWDVFRPFVFGVILGVIIEHKWF